MSRKKYEIYAVYYDGHEYEQGDIQQARFTEFYRKSDIRDGKTDIIDNWCIKCNGEFCGDNNNHCQFSKDSLIETVFEWKRKCLYVPRQL